MNITTICQSTLCCRDIHGQLAFYYDGVGCFCAFPRLNDCSAKLAQFPGQFSVIVTIQVMMLIIFVALFVYISLTLFWRWHESKFHKTVANLTLVYCWMACFGTFNVYDLLHTNYI